MRRQDSLQASGDLFRLRYCRTRGAVAIVADVIGGTFASAIKAAIHMPTELGSSATPNRVERCSLGA